MVKSLVSIGAVVLVTVGIVACPKESATKTPAAASAAPATAMPGTPTPTTAAAKRALTPEDLDPSRASPTTMASKVYRQLGIEKKSRPKVALPAERVVEAFKAAGIETDGMKQGLGEPIKAGYCALGRTKKGVGFTLCEYASAEVAREGKALSEGRYGGALARQLFLNGETLLVVRATGTDDSSAEAKAMASVFAGL